MRIGKGTGLKTGRYAEDEERFLAPLGMTKSLYLELFGDWHCVALAAAAR